MAFLGPDDILALEKNQGTVKRIINGTVMPEPLLDVNVVPNDGLLGIAVSKNGSGSTYVFFCTLLNLQQEMIPLQPNPQVIVSIDTN